MNKKLIARICMLAGILLLTQDICAARSGGGSRGGSSHGGGSHVGGSGHYRGDHEGHHGGGRGAYYDGGYYGGDTYYDDYDADWVAPVIATEIIGDTAAAAEYDGHDHDRYEHRYRR